MVLCRNFCLLCSLAFRKSIVSARILPVTSGESECVAVGNSLLSGTAVSDRASNTRNIEKRASLPLLQQSYLCSFPASCSGRQGHLDPWQMQHQCGFHGLDALQRMHQHAASACQFHQLFKSTCLPLSAQETLSFSPTCHNHWLGLVTLAVRRATTGPMSGLSLTQAKRP